MDARKHRAQTGGAVQMRLHRDDVIEALRQYLADYPLADGFALAKGRILAHIAQIGRDQRYMPRPLIP